MITYEETSRLITLKDRVEGSFQVTGKFVAKTQEHYILEMHGMAQMFRIDDWEEVRDELLLKI